MVTGVIRRHSGGYKAFLILLWSMLHVPVKVCSGPRLQYLNGHGENTAHCAERQKRIMVDVWPALKEDGILIYSTCTFNPGENEENIRWLKAGNESECIRLDLKFFPGITEIDWQGIYGLWVLS